MIEVTVYLNKGKSFNITREEANDNNNIKKTIHSKTVFLNIMLYDKSILFNLS